MIRYLKYLILCVIFSLAKKYIKAHLFFMLFILILLYIYNTWKILISRKCFILHEHLLVYEKREGKELGITSNYSLINDFFFLIEPPTYIFFTTWVPKVSRNPSFDPCINKCV